MTSAAPGRRPTTARNLTDSVPDGKNACKHNRMWLVIEDDSGAFCGTCGTWVLRHELVAILLGHELE